MPFAPKIFGIGLSKTGTTTLFAALNDLGIKTITYRHLERRNLVEWRSGDFSVDHLSDVDGATDLPIGTYFRELDKAYPGSKFILTERPLEPWLESIAKQFRGQPNPEMQFKRDARMAMYGVSTFNEDRFRQVYQAHGKAVREYFADRPGDLLIQNYFAGDGWEDLCAFLNRPIPQKPFPNVKPGYEPQRSAPQWDRTSFVIPLVHPLGKKVRDYGRVENILRETLRSITSQTSGAERVVVVCHRVPGWHAEFSGLVRFLSVGEHPGFSAGRNDVQIDKGMKYALGLQYAFTNHPAPYVMLMDGDDFLHRDFCRTVEEFMPDCPGRDGLIVTEGWNASLRPSGSGMFSEAVYRVSDFDKTCGSCRVFFCEPLRKNLETFCADLASLDGTEMADRDGNISARALGAVVEATDRISAAGDSFVRAIGRHVNQESFFDLSALERPLVAKGCGHDNHDGPRGGDIHWHRVVGVRDGFWLLRNFGLSGGAIAGRVDMRSVVKGMYNMIRNRIRFRGNVP